MPVRKGNATLVSDHYNTPKTSLVIFHFDPPIEPSSEKLKTCSISHASIENKDLYVFDNYFQKSERDGTRDYFEKATYSRYSYSTADGGEKGEKPGYSMNTKERWSLFSNPPPTVHELHKLLSFLGFYLNAEITTAPWELCHQALAVTPSVIVNFHNQVSNESMHLGKHRDCNPEKGVFFGIPILYKEEGGFHDNCFENGAPGKPWMVSMMLYAASELLLPEHRMGTAYYKTNGETAVKTNCLDGRFVLFEGDLFHSVEESSIPPEINPWRISYVLKLIINPKTEGQCVKEMFSQLLHNRCSCVRKLITGTHSRI